MMLSVAGLQLFYVIGRLLLPLYPLDFELWVGYLDSAIKLLSVGTVIVISIGLTTLPKFFHLANHGKFDDMLNHMNNVLENVTAFGMALMFGTLGMASGLTQWFLGVEYLRVGQLMMALSPVLVLVGWSTVLGGQYLRVAGKNTLVTLSMLAGLATMLVFGVLLVPNHAGFGAVVAIDLAQLVIVIMQAFFCATSIKLASILQNKLAISAGGCRDVAGSIYYRLPTDPGTFYFVYAISYWYNSLRWHHLGFT